MTKIEESLVVGGGPVGLFAAHCLFRRGVSVRVLDTPENRPPRSYACGLTPATLASFKREGLLPAVRERAHRVERLMIRYDGAQLPSSAFRDEPSTAAWFMLEQNELEGLLRDALSARGIEVLRQAEVKQISPRDGFVRVTAVVSEPCGTNSAREDRISSLSCDAKYVIGADGHFSVCRWALGVELADQGPAKVFAVHDFHADLGAWQRNACIAIEHGLVSAFWPLGARRGRWTFELQRDFHELPTLESLRALITERAPWFAPRPEQLCWGEVSEFRQSLVRRFGNGRIWLAGDAAHSAWPIGFESMNRGLREAEALASGVARALHGRPSDGRHSIAALFATPAAALTQRAAHVQLQAKRGRGARFAE